MSKVVIFGNGGAADTVARYFAKDSRFEIAGFTVDAAYRKSETFRGLPLVDFESVRDTFPPEKFKLFMLLSFDDMNALRIRKYEEGKALGYSFASYVAPDIFRIDEISVGENCFIMESQTINLDVKFGNNIVLWSGNHVGDRSVIEDHVWISSQVAIGGDVRVGKGSFLGMHATIGHDVVIAEKNFIGAGTLITKSTKPGQVFVQESTKPLPIPSDLFAKMV